MADETQTQVAEGTPPAAVPAEVAGQTVQPPQAAAPATTTGQTNGAAAQAGAATPPTATPARDGLPQAVRRELWELRQTVRELKEQANARPQAQAPVIEPEPPVSLLDDPEKYGANMEARITARAKTEILAEQSQAKDAERIAADNKTAIQLILTQKDILEIEGAIEEIEAILRGPELQEISQRYPLRAAKLAMQEWRESKGMSPARTEAAKANSNAVATVNASIQATGGPKIWTKAEVAAYLKDYNAPDFKKKEAEIFEAARAGRIK